jgi:hypothetical protein
VSYPPKFRPLKDVKCVSAHDESVSSSLFPFSPLFSGAAEFVFQIFEGKESVEGEARVARENGAQSRGFPQSTFCLHFLKSFS